MPKLATPLTDDSIANLAPRSAGYKVGDGFGLYLFVDPSGKKRWRMDYKRQGKETSVSLGSYPTLSIIEARALRDDAHELLRQGLDPVDHKRSRQLKERETRARLPKAPRLRFSMSADGGLVVESQSTRLTLNVAETEALRAFLTATPCNTRESANA